VFNVFDRDGSGSLDYKEFVDALKPDRQVGVFKAKCLYVAMLTINVTKFEIPHYFHWLCNACVYDIQRSVSYFAEKLLHNKIE